MANHIRKIKLQDLPDSSFAFACLELEEQLESRLEHSKDYYTRFNWTNNKKQLTFKSFLQNPITKNIQHFYLEGSVGSGKSTTAIAWFYELMDSYPGCDILVMRRTHAQLISSSFTQIKKFNNEHNIPAVYKESKSSGFPEIRYKNGSRWVFVSSEAAVENNFADTARGLGSTEFSGALLEEADMIHLEAVDTVPNRLRQASGVPVRLIAYVANPPVTTHWLYKRFFFFDKVDVKDQGSYNKLKFLMEDNRANLPPGFIESNHAYFRNKPALYKRMVLGESGPQIKGDPIYGPYFSRTLHVASDSFIANWRKRQLWKDGPVCLNFDFGYVHPALVVFQDVQIGTFSQIRVLASWLGDSITLRVWAKYLLDQLHKLLPNAEFETYCDPAGSQADPRGVTTENAFDVLKSLGLNPRGKKTDESGGIDLIIDLLKNITNHPVLGMQPEIIFEPDEKYAGEVVTMVEIGFTQDANSRSGKLKPNDDNYFIHLADALRYGVVNRRSLRRPRPAGYSPTPIERDPLRPYTSNFSDSPDLYLPESMSHSELQDWMNGNDDNSNVASYFGR